MNLFGWIPPAERNTLQCAVHERIVSMMPPFPADDLYRNENGRFSLWQAGTQLLSHPLQFNYQQTGSCVGAGGGNCVKVLMAVEIVLGNQPEEYRELWWPFTYGRSRFRAGMTTPGEGSMGSAYAEAAAKDGFIAHQEYPSLPQFQVSDNWLVLNSNIEYSWSDGDARQSMDLLPAGRMHLVGQVARVRNGQEGKAALQNGYPLTIASNFGTRGPRRTGNPAINLAEWDDNWPHQMSISECWDHPTEGLVFFVQNNWGPRAHPAPTQGEPVGGFYIREKTLDRICRDEVFAFSGLNGWQARTIPWIW